MLDTRRNDRLHFGGKTSWASQSPTSALGAPCLTTSSSESATTPRVKPSSSRLLHHLEWKPAVRASRLMVSSYAAGMTPPCVYSTLKTSPPLYTSHSSLPPARRSTLFIVQLWRPEERTTVHPAYVGVTTLTTTQRSSSVQTDTTSKRYAMHHRYEQVTNLRPLRVRRNSRNAGEA